MQKDILEKLKQIKPELLKKYGINKIALFGSHARGDFKDNSDVDVVIMDMKKKNLLTISKAQFFLEEKLNKNIDLGHFDSLRPLIRKEVEKGLLCV